MAENKTRATGSPVAAFLDQVQPPARAEEGRAICALMERVTGEPATMWGPSIIGFGRYRYRYESGREGEMARVGFSPRKPQLVFYGLPLDEAKLARLGKHSTGKGCLYVKKLSDVDLGVVEELVRAGFERRKADEI